MDFNEPLYRPREYYETMLKNQYHETAISYFNDLAQAASVDEAANAEHVRLYEEAMKEVEAARKKLGKVRAGKGWATAGVIISFILAVLAIAIAATNLETMWYLFIAGGVLIGLGILFIVLLCTKIKRAVAIANEELAAKEAVANEALKVCQLDMAALNASFDDMMPAAVMERCTPIIDLDLVFSPERLCYLMERFGMGEETDPNTSVLGVISGHIQGNPFILEKVGRHEVRDKTYYGELTIHWTTTHTDSKGNTYTETHSETLHAETVHPAPSYWDETRLIYGSEVAPNLHFSRSPSGATGLKEKDARKFVEKRNKEMSKKAEKAIKEGRQYNPMNNDEFEAYFGADDRDNEVEFRLLFDPLAQRNELDLIKNPAPFGDDFIMVKDGMLTSVATTHSQSFNYQIGADYFRDYNFVNAKNRFIDYCDNFIKNLFFDLAPIISIPLYQVHKPSDYIYGGNYGCMTTSFEHEAMANRMDHELFRPKDSDPTVPVFLKQAAARATGESDEVRIYSFSYVTTPMVDYVSKLGGDGRWHDVPVHWIQYDEVSTYNNIGVSNSGRSRPQFYHPQLERLRNYFADRGLHFERGLFSYFLGADGHISGEMAQNISSSLSVSDGTANSVSRSDSNSNGNSR